MTRTRTLIRFPQGMFPELRTQLLQEQQRETFALLLGKRTLINDLCVIRVVELTLAGPDDYEAQSLLSLRLKREFIYRQLIRMLGRDDVDTLIDVHTHPFCESGAAFSAHDDQDEASFHRWIQNTLDDVGYASIVLSKTDYAARLWEMGLTEPMSSPARIKTQIVAENWPCAEPEKDERISVDNRELTTGFLARGTLALGVDTMRAIVTDQSVAVIGVGGLGSVIAEHLVHHGFQSIRLIDPDQVELTNLNRIVGAYYRDAMGRRLKVDVVRDHLLRINPNAQVYAHATGVEDAVALEAIMQCDWILLATDNHFSRYRAQALALQLGVPLISAGVNISVDAGQLTDMSGEVIIARYGDRLCLNCLGRINPTLVAVHEHRRQPIGEELIRRGYVAGEDVKEPAVKTLNAMLGTLAVNTLLNQYTQRQPVVPIRVFEDNQGPVISSDEESVLNRPLSCFSCGDA